MKFNSADEFFKQCGEYQVVLRRYDSTGTFFDASVMVTLEELFQHVFHRMMDTPWDATQNKPIYDFDFSKVAVTPDINVLNSRPQVWFNRDGRVVERPPETLSEWNAQQAIRKDAAE